MSKSKVALGTLLIFALGVFVGVFGANIYFKHRIEQLFSKREPPPVVDLFMKRLSDKIDLTDTQRCEIEAIVGQSHRELRKVRKKYRPEIEAIINQTFAEIEKKLDKDQQQQFKKFREHFRFHPGRKMALGKLPSSSLERSVHQFFAEVDKKLTLSEDRRLGVYEILENHMAGMGSVFKNSRRGRTSETIDVSVALQSLNQRTEDQLRTILTEEQMVVYKSIWNERRRQLWDELRRTKQAGIAEE